MLASACDIHIQQDIDMSTPRKTSVNAQKYYLRPNVTENLLTVTLNHKRTICPLVHFLNAFAVAAHLRTFLKECGSIARTIFPGKRIHLRTQFPQVNVTFAHTRFS